MKINFSALFGTSIQKYSFFFIFGNDEMTFERAISFLQKRLPFPIQLKTEEELLINTPAAPSLFNDQELPLLVLVPHVTDKLLKGIEQLKEGIFIFTSEKARAQSKLVTYFSQSPRSLAVGAYASPLIASEFEFLVEGMNLPQPFKMHLFKAFVNDYKGLLTALEKIKMYGDVPPAHYDHFLASSCSSEELTPLIHAFLARNSEKVVGALSALNALEVIPFLRTLGRTFHILFELMPFKQSPRTISWQGLSAPVFFKDQPFYEAALSKWSAGEVHIVLEGVLSLEQQVKFSALPLSVLKQQLVGTMGVDPQNI